MPRAIGEIGLATLITGLGYIGSALARRLLQSGEHVVAVENYFSCPRAPIESLASEGRLTIVEGSIADPETVRRAFSIDQVDVVFHLAAQASASSDAATVGYTQETNYTGPRVVLDACARAGVKRVVVASSTRMYRTPLPRHISEASAVDPRDLVHLSHLYCERLLDAYRACGAGFTGIAARLGTVHGVGPVMKTDPRFLAAPQRLCLDAATRRAIRVDTERGAVLALVHLDDAVEGLLRCLELPPEVRVANVSAEVRSLRSLGETVRRAAAARGIDVEMQLSGPSLPDRPHTVTSVLDRHGFKPGRNFKESVGEVLEYYLAFVQSGGA